MDLKVISDSELVNKLNELTGSEREVTLQVLHFLNELDRRQLFRELGYSSLYDYCLKKLRYSENGAYRRIAAARAIVINPELGVLFLKGEVSLCTMATAAKSLKSKETAVSEICNKTKREVLALLQTQEFQAKPKEVVIPVKVSPPKAPLLPESPVEERVGIKFSLSKEDYAHFEEVRAKLSNALGSKLTIEAVFSKLVKSFLAKPRNGKPRVKCTKSSRYITHQVKHEVYKRDHGTCTFVATDGTRCAAKTHLHYDHILPYAAGGSSEASNLRLLCATHNKLEAERFFGKGFIESQIQKGSTLPGQGDLLPG